MSLIDFNYSGENERRLSSANRRDDVEVALEDRRGLH